MTDHKYNARVVKLLQRAQEHDLGLSAEDIVPDPLDGEPTIGGMLAEDWLDAMTAD